MSILVVASRLLRLTTPVRPAVSDQSLRVPPFCRSKFMAALQPLQSLSYAEDQPGRQTSRRIFLEPYHASASRRRPSCQAILACSHAAQNDTPALSPHRERPPSVPASCPNKPQETSLPSCWCISSPPADRSHPVPRQREEPRSVDTTTYRRFITMGPGGRDHVAGGAVTNQQGGRTARQALLPAFAPRRGPRGGADKR